MSKKKDKSIKICFLGDEGVGKKEFIENYLSKIDDYFSFLCFCIAFSENSLFFKINPYMQALFHVIIDVAIMIIWVLVKKKIIEKLIHKSRNKA